VKAIEPAGAGPGPGEGDGAGAGGVGDEAIGVGAGAGAGATGSPAAPEVLPQAVSVNPLNATPKRRN
jgi:hypothetical protein